VGAACPTTRIGRVTTNHSQALQHDQRTTHALQRPEPPAQCCSLLPRQTTGSGSDTIAQQTRTWPQVVMHQPLGSGAHGGTRDTHHFPCSRSDSRCATIAAAQLTALLRGPKPQQAYRKTPKLMRVCTRVGNAAPGWMHLDPMHFRGKDRLGRVQAAKLSTARQPPLPHGATHQAK
jgi:hypothetical protein